MSSSSTVLNTGQMAITNFDRAKIFIFDNRYQKGEVNSSGYNPLTLSGGTLMGRVAATGRLAPYNALASDGTEYPVGILAEDISIDSGDTYDATICDFGDVAEEKVLFYWAGQTLNTQVGTTHKRVRDYLQAQGIKLVSGTEMTQNDNQ